MDTQLLNALHPFSFVTDSVGNIKVLGRSLIKIYPDIRQKQSLAEAFKIAQPLPSDPNSPHSLQGELLVLVHPTNSSLRLRGPVVKLQTSPPSYLFSVTPAVSAIEQIQQMNVELRDFPIGDPIFDFLVHLQTQKKAREAAESARQRLEWENQISNLLHKLTLRTQYETDPRQVYRSVLSQICQTLELDIGHAIIPTLEDPSIFESSKIWSFSPNPKLRAFQTQSESIRFSHGQGMIGAVLERRSAVLTMDVKEGEFLTRCSPLSDKEHVLGVAVPVICNNDLRAVMEFYGSRKFPDPNSLRRFFDLLGVHVSNIMMRLESLNREKEHLASLVNASKMATLGEITAGVAHEINNPLHTLSLSAQVVKKMSSRGLLTEAALSKQLAIIESSVERMARIVEELTAFSRDSARDPMTPTSLSDIVSETLDLCHARFANDDIKVYLAPLPPYWTVECRSSQISQVLLNLLNNAHDAILELKEKWIRVECADIGTAHTIRVTDSGGGIPPEVATKIMAPFFTTKPTGRGTGLGLSISSNILTDHGGWLIVDQEASNTSFVITIPKKQEGQLLQQAV